jgi:hypothetical protein
MSVVTSQQISKLYQAYAGEEVLFNKDVTRALMLNGKGVHIRCFGYQWPCIIHSSSMTGAKLIVNMKSSIKQIVEKANRNVGLNFSFIQRDRTNPVSFIMKAKVIQYTPYHPEKPDLNFMHIQFSNRAPDELIFRLGDLLDAQTQANDRKDDRIIVNPDTQRILKLAMKDAVAISIDNIPRKCILRDLSFGGAKVIIFGVPNFLVNKSSVLTLKFEDPYQTIAIPGKVLRFEEVQGRKDLAAFAIRFDDETLPSEYKLRLNQYFKLRKK